MKITPNQTWYWRHRGRAQRSCCLEPVVLCPPCWRPGAHRVPEQECMTPLQGHGPSRPSYTGHRVGLRVTLPPDLVDLCGRWCLRVSAGGNCHPADSSRCSSRGFLYKYRHAHTFLLFSQVKYLLSMNGTHGAEGAGHLGGDPASAPADLLPGLFHPTTVLEYI